MKNYKLHSTVVAILMTGIFIFGVWKRDSHAAAELFPPSAQPKSILEPITVANAPRMTQLTRLGYGRLRKIAWSPDNLTLAVTSSIGILLYTTTDPASAPQVLESPTVGITSLTWRPDGHALAVGGTDGTVRLWDTEQGVEYNILRGHTAAVIGVDWHPNGTLIASSSEDGTVRLWEAVSGKEQTVLVGHTGRVDGVAWSPQGALLASAGWDGTIRMWNPVTGMPVKTMGDKITSLRTVAFIAGGRMLVTGDWNASARLWSVETGAELDIFRADLEYAAASPVEPLVAVGKRDFTIELWDALTAERVRSPSRTYHRGHRHRLQSGWNSVSLRWRRWGASMGCEKPEMRFSNSKGMFNGHPVLSSVRTVHCSPQVVGIPRCGCGT